MEKDGGNEIAGRKTFAQSQGKKRRPSYPAHERQEKRHGPVGKFELLIDPDRSQKNRQKQNEAKHVFKSYDARGGYGLGKPGSEKRIQRPKRTCNHDKDRSGWHG